MDRKQASQRRTPLFFLFGEGIDLFSIPLPRTLIGKTLAQSNIGAKTGLNVITVQQNGIFITSPPASTLLKPGSELLVFGDVHQRRHFTTLFGSE